MNNWKLLALWLLACFASAFAPAPAFAQPPGTHPSYVSIQMRTEPLDAPPTTQSVCGGVVVDEKRKLVATAWHCVPNMRSAIEKPGVFSANGMNAKFVAFLPEADLALFQVDDLKGVKTPTFKTPKKGDSVTASAFYDNFPVTPQGQGDDRFFPSMTISGTIDWEGKVAIVATAKETRDPRFAATVKVEPTWIVITGNPAPGFSGGPVFDKSGGFVGIVSNGNGGYTNVSSSGNVIKMLQMLK